MRADNRAALLKGARACLDERGYARTRARDVASAAGVSTAAIGYHFGTTEALLVEALLQGLEEWSAQLDSRLAGMPRPQDPDHLAAVYRCVVESFPGHRGVLAASFELIAQADDHPEVREQLRQSLHHARRSLAQQMLGVDAEVDQHRADRVGAACYAMLSGLIVQWLVDPDSLPEPTVVSAELSHWRSPVATSAGLSPEGG